jgi:hypothetical protein
MSRKKKFQKSTPKDFTNSPFKSLKGLSAFEQKSHEQSEPAQLADRCAEDEYNEQGEFAAEMDFLGVKPLKDEIRESSETFRTMNPASQLPQVPIPILSRPSVPWRRFLKMNGQKMQLKSKPHRDA